ncbi:MAG: phosphate ABC transporter substrate-binding protein [Deltaproteobacteria bacterium]|nr:phosphate ABC transporter substrate-binding protein [Deltaproteobacteria bacterium]
MRARTAQAIGLMLSLLLAAAACSKAAPPQETLLIAGNAALARYLAPVIKEFQARHPRASVVCEPGGTTAAVIALKRGAIDVAALSRLVAAEEDDPSLRDYQVCRDGIAIVVNPKNPVSELSLKQLDDIFSGDLTSWKQVGGADAPIVAYSREKAGGSSRSFSEMVLGGDDPFSGVKKVASGKAMIAAVAADPNGIGYLSLRRVSTEVKVAKVEGVEMSRLTMLSGRYPLSRTFYLGLYSKPSPLAEEFVRFTLSKEGQALLAEEGLLSVR